MQKLVRIIVFLFTVTLVLLSNSWAATYQLDVEYNNFQTYYDTYWNPPSPYETANLTMTYEAESYSSPITSVSDFELTFGDRTHALEDLVYNSYLGPNNGTTYLGDNSYETLVYTGTNEEERVAYERLNKLNELRSEAPTRVFQDSNDFTITLDTTQISSGGDLSTYLRYSSEGHWSNMWDTSSYNNYSLVDISIDPEPTPEPRTFGLFLGSEDHIGTEYTDENGETKWNGGVMGGTQAAFTYQTFIDSGFMEDSNTALLIGENATSDNIEAAIETFGLTENDTLYIYYSGHGSTDTTAIGEDINGEPIEIPYNEYIATGHPYYLYDDPRDPLYDPDHTPGADYLSDDDLTRILSELEYDSIEKWVILDSCYAGGFWGELSQDGEDLSTLENISLLAAVGESQLASYAWVSPNLYDLLPSPFDFNGEGLFTHRLLQGLEKEGDRYIADTDDKIGISLEEWEAWFSDISFMESLIYGNDLDRVVLLPGDFYVPDSGGQPLTADALMGAMNGVSFYATDDFTGYSSTEPVPEPSTIFLLGSGLAGLAFYRRKKK